MIYLGRRRKDYLFITVSIKCCLRHSYVPLNRQNNRNVVLGLTSRLQTNLSSRHSSLIISWFAKTQHTSFWQEECVFVVWKLSHLRILTEMRVVVGYGISALYITSKMHQQIDRLIHCDVIYLNKHDSLIWKSTIFCSKSHDHNLNKIPSSLRSTYFNHVEGLFRLPPLTTTLVCFRVKKSCRWNRLSN